MTDEAETVATAPEERAPEKTSVETEEAVAAEAGQAAEGQEQSPPKGADDEDAAPASAETEEDGEDKPKKRTRTAELRHKVRERDAEIAELRRQIAEREASEFPAPKEADFNGDFEAYNRALIAHETARLLRTGDLEREKRSVEAQQRIVEAERHEIHMERVEEARKAIPDYDAVIQKGLNVDAPKANLAILLESDKSALIAYHLAEKPERVREFAGMSPLEAAKHIGKLEARLSLPKPKTTTSAPAPVGTLKGAAIASSPEKDLDAWLKKTYG